MPSRIHAAQVSDTRDDLPADRQVPNEPKLAKKI